MRCNIHFHYKFDPYREGQDLARNQMCGLSRVKLQGSTTGSIENRFAMFFFEIPVTSGKLVSYLSVERTDTTTGDTAARTNIMAVSGVIKAGALVKPDTDPETPPTPDGNGNFTATWSSNPNAIGYYIDIANDENFLDMVPGYSNKPLQPSDYVINVDTVEYTVSDIKNGPVYYRVRAVNSDGKQGPSSDSVKVPIGGEVVSDSSLKLNKPVIVDEKAKTYSFSNAINPGDRITLPSVSGFTVSSTTNDYSKRITVGAGKTANHIQEYLRQIVFQLGTDGQAVQVSLSNEVVSNDTFYYEPTGHYYQYVPLSGGSATWMSSYNDARKMTYAGRQGYLATITSEGEDMFIKSLSGQIGWLGGTRMIPSGTKVTYKNDTDTAANGAKQYYQGYVNLSKGTGKTHDASAAHGTNDAAGWIWACGPEIGDAIPMGRTGDVTPYANWNTGTGETDGIEADGDVVAEDSNLDIIVTGRPGKGIDVSGKPGKVDIKGDTQLDIEVKPGDPDYDPDGDGKKDNNPAIDGDLVVPKIDPTKPDGPKPNIKVDGQPVVTGDITDDQVPANPIQKPTDPTKPFDYGTDYAEVLLYVPGTRVGGDPVKVTGAIGAAIAEVSDVTLTMGTDTVIFAKTGIKVGDKLNTNCAGVSAVVTGVTETKLTLKLTGTPTKNCGLAVAVTIPAGAMVSKVEGATPTKVSVKVIDDTAQWAIKLGDTIGRDDPLNLKPDPLDPDKKIEYIDENGEKKEADPDEDITDTAEGWEWYPKPTDPTDPRGDTVEIDGKEYKRPVMILDDVDIKPADPTKPAIEVPDDVTIVVPPGSDNIIEGHPAIKVGPNDTDPTEPPEITITGPGNLILTGLPKRDPSDPKPGTDGEAVEGPAADKKPVIKLDPDVIVTDDRKQPTQPEAPDYEYPTKGDNELKFGHVSATLDNVKKGGIVGTTNVAISETKATVTLENASLMPGKVTTRTTFATNVAGVFAVNPETSGGNSVKVTLKGTPAAVTSEKIVVYVPAEYVLEGAALTATSTEKWNITNPPAPNPGDGGGETPSAPGSVEVDGKDKNVDVKKEVKREDDKKIDIFTPDKKQLDDIIKDLPRGDEIVIDVKRDPDADEVIVVINGETLEEMGKKELDLKVLDTPISVNIPTKDIDIGPILEELGGDAKDVDVNIRIYEPTDEEKEAIRKAIETDGSKQTDEPISFEIFVSKDGKTVPVDGFDGYVTIALQITEEQAKLITTAITWQKDGSLLHIPTYVYKEGGKYYVQVNALVNCTTTLIFNEQKFVDTAGTWYDAVATELASRKIMNGVGNGKFEGGLNITRAEFAVIVVRALGLPVNDTNMFSDVSGDDWYAGAAGAASKYGIVNGADGKFMPMNQITRQEAMAIIARAAKVAEYTGTTGSVSSYPDSSTLADWAREAAAMTVGSGLIKGNDGMIRPTDTITRGETAVLILRLLQKADLVDVRSST